MLPRALIPLALCVLVPTALPVEALPLANPGFEEPGPAESAVGWRVERGPAPTVRRAGECRSGQGCLEISLSEPGSVVVASEPLELHVGHLYRLGAWIRTESALSDPTTRYPTAVPATLSMASFPFTNHAPAVGGTRGWTRVETLFLATSGTDRVRLHLGHNGTATGRAVFDDVSLEKVDDIEQLIPYETVRWFGDAYRYDDRGWIFVHIEGEPYERGYQYGYLVAEEIVAYMTKLGWNENRKDGEQGWRTLRFIADATMLRKYDEEYLTEMKGIADGAARAGAEYHGRPVDLVDIVTINSVVDIGQMRRAMGITPHALTGQSFLGHEEEMAIPDDEHSCSAFVATGPATRDGDIVFGQIFMWGGYTGVHWDVITDVVPSRGHRLVYHTFPGGIHSGADFYINEAGIVIGETTVSQTPYDAEGTPQSNRIRRAAQYADSIDDVAAILSKQNNGMYTNDWPIADVETKEAAIFLLGTHQSKLWRTGEDMAPFGLPGFLWANNNNRDPEVRKEYIAQPEDRPYDLVFSPWNRDIAFNEFYREHAGVIDATAAVNLWASSPINRSHACDGKITTGEMARELVFLAHYGKVTLREKFPQVGSRRMPDLPGAIPHLSLGYSVASPKFVTDRLHELRDVKRSAAAPEAASPEVEEVELSDGLRRRFEIDRKSLWRRTVFPASPSESWFVSASAAYWRMLRALPAPDEEVPDEGRSSLTRDLAEVATRYAYTISREEDLAAVDARRAYDRYGPYRIPRAKGTVALHQLRLELGNERFLSAMRAVHERFAETYATTDEILAALSDAAGRSVRDLVRPWIEVEGPTDVEPRVTVTPEDDGTARVVLEVTNRSPHARMHSAIAFQSGDVTAYEALLIEGRSSRFEFDLPAVPDAIVFDPFFELLVPMPQFYTWPNVVDDFHDLRIVYGTARQIEANHTLALRWQETLADAYVEILPPLVKDAELSPEERGDFDLIALGSAEDNGYIRAIAPRLEEAFELTIGQGWFRWRGEIFDRADQGLLLAAPNPDAPGRALYLFLANGALELHRMTQTYRRGLPSWAVFEGDEIVARGFHEPFRFVTEASLKEKRSP